MNKKILTIQEAQELKLKPWKTDLDQLRQEIENNVGNGVGFALAGMQIEINLSKADIYIRLCDFDDAFILSNNTTKIKGIDINTIHMIVEMWTAIKKKLSNNFVDKNPEVCKNAIALLEKVRTNKVFDKVQCNKIINRLYEKGKIKEVEDEDKI